jgi:CheY-like chemotaxis protein
VVKAVAVLDDLFFAAKILDAASQLGLETEIIRPADFKPARLAQPRAAVLIVDLNATSADPIALIRQLKSDPALGSVPVVGFVSHVQVELQQAARAAGCDQVLPRSKFSATLPDLLRRYTAHIPAP